MKVKKAIIPAAGFGTRMLPATKVIPKEMLPLIDKPGIQYIVEEAVASGIEDILIITSRGKSTICDHFDYSPELEAKLEADGRGAELAQLRAIAHLANITFIRQKSLKGLGHAVWCARSFTGNDPFAVLLGDDVMRSDTPVLKQLIDVSEHYGCSSVSVHQVGSDAIHKYCSLDVTPLSDRVFDVHRLIEKPKPEQVMSNYAILGRYLLTGGIFPILESLSPGYGGEIQLTDGLNALCQRERILAVDFEGTRFDTGNLQGYLEAIVQLGICHDQVGEWFREYLKKLNL